jgi:hypothetical protein
MEHRLEELANGVAEAIGKMQIFLQDHPELCNNTSIQGLIEQGNGDTWK